MTLRSLAGGRLFAEIVGEGRPLVVLLHGWGRDRKDLSPVSDGLAGETVLVDLPGFGSSPPPPSAWGARDYAALVGDAVDELRPRTDGHPTQGAPVVLAGHSFGGRVAVCLAAERRWISGLLLCGVPLLRKAGVTPSVRFRAARALHRRGLVPDATMERYRRRHGSDDYRRAHGVMRETLVRVVGESYEAELAALRCPTRFVWGEHDTAAPIAMARAAAELMAAPHTFVTVEAAGHDVHRERPDLLRREITTLGEAAR